MEKILSQDEINALFSAMSSDDLSLNETHEKTGAPRKVAKYDFHRADRISQDQMRSLHLLHDFFGRNFSSSLSAYLRAFVDVKLASVEQVSYAEFLKLLPDPTLFSSLAMRPMDSNVILELNPSVAFPMIDMLLGGPGTVLASERNPTEIEINIIEGVVRLVMRDLREAWRPIMEVDFFLEGSETKPQRFQIVSPGEAVVALAFEIKLGENSGMMHLCIPSRMLKVIRSKFDQQWSIRRQKVAASEVEKILGLLRHTDFPLTGEIHDNNLTVGDLLRVTVGDIIQLNYQAGDPVLLCVGGLPKFEGRIIAKRGKKALEISQKLSA